MKSELNSPVPVEVYPELNKIIVRDTGIDKNTVKTFSYDKVFGPDSTQVRSLFNVKQVYKFVLPTYLFQI